MIVDMKILHVYNNFFNFSSFIMFCHPQSDRPSPKPKPHKTNEPAGHPYLPSLSLNLNLNLNLTLTLTDVCVHAHDVTWSHPPGPHTSPTTS